MSELVDEPVSKKLKTEDTDICKGESLISDNAKVPVGGEKAEPSDHRASEDDPTDVIVKHITETDVGIVAYRSEHDGFEGVIKQRYSDFLVNEVDRSGKIVQLTDIDGPKIEKQAPPEVVEEVTQILSDTERAALQELLQSSDKTATVTVQSCDDKVRRTKIHEAIRAGFPGLDSTTQENKGGKAILVKHKVGDDRHNWWPRERPSYCQFVLYKENKDTMDTVNFLAKLLRLRSNVFSYAGTKDRRAKTTQNITAFRVPAEKLHSLNSTLQNMALGNFSFVSEALKLGDLLGNRFTVVLRNVIGSDEQINKALHLLRDHGFINYYGMQRFGTTSVPTHHIGRSLLCEDLKQAVELILGPRDSDFKESVEFREVWHKTHDPVATLDILPRYHTAIERSLLEGLQQCGCKNYNSALNRIARNTRLMYVHSYQSYIWNSAVTHRLSVYGDKPVLGDLVIKRDSGVDSDAGSTKLVPCILDASNLSEYTLEDVVLPLPGFDVIYPKNDIHSWLKEMLSKDGLDLDNMRNKNRDYSLPGAYRHIIVRPEGLEWEVSHYNDVTVPLVLSDLDKLQLLPKPEDLPESKYKALVLRFTLQSSAYATMALRELLRTDTSSASQAKLNMS